MNKGDYVLATKYGDGDPLDQWCVGFYDRFDPIKGRHYVVDDLGMQFRANGFRRCEEISKSVGKQLLEHADRIESQQINVWHFVSVVTRNKLQELEDAPKTRTCLTCMGYCPNCGADTTNA